MLIIILHYLDESNLITRVLIRGRQEEQSQRENLEDATLLALKVEEGATSQGCKWPLAAGKGMEADSPLEPAAGTQLC